MLPIEKEEVKRFTPFSYVFVVTGSFHSTSL
jgi:hypothetical protein